MPVLILTARGEEADKVFGFRLGADDYVTKPLSLSELLARVNAILRRAKSDEREGNGASKNSATYPINTLARSVKRADTDVGLTPKEFDLLLALIRRRGAVVSRLELLKEVWGHQAEVMTRTVDIHIAEFGGNSSTTLRPRSHPHGLESRLPPSGDGGLGRPLADPWV